jgi:hypothetical protein
MQKPCEPERPSPAPTPQSLRLDCPSRRWRDDWYGASRSRSDFAKFLGLAVAGSAVGVTPVACASHDPVFLKFALVG